MFSVVGESFDWIRSRAQSSKVCNKGRQKKQKIEIGTRSNSPSRGLSAKFIFNSQRSSPVISASQWEKSPKKETVWRICPLANVILNAQEVNNNLDLTK